MSIAHDTNNRSNYLLNEITEGHRLEEGSRAQWREGVKRQALALAEKRAEFPADQDFGAWLSMNGADYYGKDDRAAYIKLGQHPEAIDVVLSESKSTSVQLIVRHELDIVLERFRSVTKPADPRGQNQNKPETASILEDFVGSADQNVVEIARPLPYVPPPRGKPALLYQYLGNDGAVLLGYFHSDRTSHTGSPRIVVQLNKAVHSAKGKKVARKLAKFLATGKYGQRVPGQPHVLSPTLFCPNIPQRWGSRFTGEATPDLIDALCDALPNLTILNQELAEKKPSDPDTFCGHWWYDNVEHKQKMEAKPAPTTAEQQANKEAVLAQINAVPELVHSAFADYKGDERFKPDQDADIVVYGRRIYQAGSESPEVFTQIFAAFKLWQMFERQFARIEPNARERGAEYRRMQVYSLWVSPAFGRTLWQIGHAMYLNPDSASETFGPRERGVAA